MSIASAEVRSDSDLPRRVTVVDLLSSRYPTNHRPTSWDSRVSGIDVVRDSDGQEVKLLSDGMQTPPQNGWVIMLMGGDSVGGFSWTLYGLPRA